MQIERGDKKMSNNSYAHIIEPSWLMRCSVCSHYVGEHSDKGCVIAGCECGNGLYDMARDMRSGDLRGYVERFSEDTKIAVLIGSSYHIFDIISAEKLLHFILSIVDVAKMTVIPEQEVFPNHRHIYVDGYCSCGHYIERSNIPDIRAENQKKLS